MRYSILGPLSVTDDEQVVAVTAGRDRVVLAMLLLHPGHVLGVGSLVEAVWGADPPATARGQLQTCVSRLRRALPEGAIESDPAGYRINVADGELDSVVFGQLVAQARSRADPSGLRRALDLWRGDALVGIESHSVRLAAAALDEQHVAVLEDWIELEMAAGRQRELIGELTTLVERFPLRERLRGQLIRVLAATGRPGDALAEYRRARDVLREELGIDPGRPLQDLHRRILEGEAVSEAVPAPQPAAAPVRSLPRTVTDFTGRDSIVGSLLRAVEHSGPLGPVVLAVDGMAGSGKTTLALHVAALVGDRYPDAHLFVDLHGHSDREPLEPGAALLVLLRQLGIGAEQVPAERAERADLWRNELAARRALVILDNAASSAQVVELLPAAAGVLVLVTSRRRLLGLDGVHTESLPVLGEAEAIALLARIAGDRVLAEAEAAADVVRRCGGLPLAIRLAGARLAHRPRWQVADLVRRIGASALPELAAENRTVASAFALSYGQLPGPAQQVFRLLGAYPGPSFDALAVAATADLPLDEARDVLDDLVDVHLVEEPETGVFRLHDLLREYAAALAVQLPGSERRAAVVRAVDFELHAALATLSAAQLARATRDIGPVDARRPDLVAALDEPQERLERVRTALRALVAAAVDAGRPDYSWRLPRAAWRWLWMRGYTDDIETLFTETRAAVRQTSTAQVQGMVANYLASAHYRRARHEEAIALLKDAMRLCGDSDSVMTTLRLNLVAIYNSSGRWVESAEVSTVALRLIPPDDDVNTAMCLDVAAVADSFLGRHDQAIRYQRRRLLLLIGMRDELSLLGCLLHIVQMRRRAGRIGSAVAERYYRIVLRHMIRLRHRAGEADVRSELGDLLRTRGRYAEAMSELRQALEIFTRVGDRRLHGWVLNAMAQTMCQSGDPVAAADLHLRALTLGRAHSQPFEEARAHLGLGDCAAVSDPAAAQRHWREAAEIFARLQVPERYDAEQRLAALDNGADRILTI